MLDSFKSPPSRARSTAAPDEEGKGEGDVECPRCHKFNGADIKNCYNCRKKLFPPPAPPLPRPQACETPPRLSVRAVFSWALVHPPWATRSLRPSGRPWPRTPSRLHHRVSSPPPRSPPTWRPSSGGFGGRVASAPIWPPYLP